MNLASRRGGLLFERMRGLARQWYSLGGDLQSIGLDCEAADDAELEATLAGLEAHVETLARLVARRRNQLVADQLRRLWASMAPPFKLHVGAGGSHIAGWVNIDVPPAELSLNIGRGVPLPDGCVSHVYASHLLEHLYYPGEARRFLTECKRLLQPGGRIRLIVPDIGACIRAYAEADAAFFEQRRRQWEGWPAGRTMLEDFLAYAGAFPDPAAFFETHKYGYDFETLAALLNNVGFEQVRRCRFQGSDDPVLRVDDHSYVAGAVHDDGYFSLFVEASA